MAPAKAPLLTGDVLWHSIKLFFSVLVSQAVALFASLGRPFSGARQFNPLVPTAIIDSNKNIIDLLIVDSRKDSHSFNENIKLILELENYWIMKTSMFEKVILGSAFFSMVFSIILWLLFADISSLFVGLWVPSILGLGIFLKLKGAEETT
ncbi:MAG: hypothetical protein MUO53_15875 [Maribacter sp.]|nr:hypothetical protein [Maribacter sp.]